MLQATPVKRQGCCLNLGQCKVATRIFCYDVHSVKAEMQCHVSFIHHKHLLSVLTANAALLQHRVHPRTRSHQRWSGSSPAWLLLSVPDVLGNTTHVCMVVPHIPKGSSKQLCQCLQKSVSWLGHLMVLPSLPPWHAGHSLRASQWVRLDLKPEPQNCSGMCKDSHFQCCIICIQYCAFDT